MRWETKDFDSMGWHDVRVHAFRLEEGENGCGTLVLDIDYILEWFETRPYFRFRVAPATLRFHEVTDFRLSLDFPSLSAGFGPFSLAGITREEFTFPNGYHSYKWRLDINWPVGELTFTSPQFVQEIAGPEVTSERQSLLPSERSRAGI